jgi:hypothetical protein
MQISELTIKPTTKWAWFRYRLDWLREQPVSTKLSRRINELLDDPSTTVTADDYVMYLGDLSLWVANFPFAYGTFWDQESKYILMPSLIELVPNTPAWVHAKNRLDQLQTYQDQYGKRCPDAATIWRLRQTELAARNLLTNTQP